MGWVQRLISFFISGPLFRIFFKFRVGGLENIKGLRGPVLIVANHKFFLDSFALGAAMPFFSRLFPARIMGENDFFYNPILEFLHKIGFIKLVYLICGVFPAIRHQGLEVAMRKPVEIIKKGGIVFLHPEGQIMKGNEIGEFKRGAPYLAIKTGVDILPVVFKMQKKGTGRRIYNVKFGCIFKLPNNLSVEQGAEYMRKTILDLYLDKKGYL